MYVQVCLGGLISVCFAYTYQDREITGEVKQVYPSIFAGGAFAARAGPTPRTRQDTSRRIEASPTTLPPEGITAPVCRSRKIAMSS